MLFMPDQPHNDAAKPKKPLSQKRDNLRLRNTSYETPNTYVGWARLQTTSHV